MLKLTSNRFDKIVRSLSSLPSRESQQPSLMMPRHSPSELPACARPPPRVFWQLSPTPYPPRAGADRLSSKGTLSGNLARRLRLAPSGRGARPRPVRLQSSARVDPSGRRARPRWREGGGGSTRRRPWSGTTARSVFDASHSSLCPCPVRKNGKSFLNTIDCRLG